MKPALPEVPTVDSEVTQIKAIQTDPKTGATEYTLTADSLIQNANGQDEMLGATIHWQPPQGETYTLTLPTVRHLNKTVAICDYLKDFGWCVQPLLLSLK